MAIDHTTPPHQPTRGSDVERWLRNCRDQYEPNTEDWHTLDELLDDYRFRADTGTAMDALVGGPGGDPEWTGNG